MLSSAPYRHDLADGPEEARGVWVETCDGLRLRIGIFETGSRGTVLMFPGRTEAVEKYGRLAQLLGGMGYSSVAIDWRGQGFADRMLDDPLIGHVEHFHDYQHDVDAVMAAVRTASLPAPYFLLAHSMGGAIGLRALLRGLDVRAVVFSGPMWGINLPFWARPVAGLLGSGARLVGLHERYAPTTGPDPYILSTPFEENLLTRTREGLEYMAHQVRQEPKLALAGPSIQWVYAAHMETRDLARVQSPDLPCFVLMGENERIVSKDAISARIAAWDGAQLLEVPSAEHEVFMEGPEKLAPVMARIGEFFEDHRPLTTPRV